MRRVTIFAGQSKWSRWAIVLMVLQGFIGLLTLEAWAKPGEMPRSALERLAGDVAGHALSLKMPMTPTEADGCCPPQDGAPKPHHGNFRTCCTLCGLLHLPPGLLPSAITLPLPISGLFQRRLMISFVAIIVARYASLPPSRAPPPEV